MSEAVFLSIIPATFNEKKNIEPLVKKLHRAMQNTNFSYEILFVDDSTDETPAVIQKEMNNDPRVKMLHRTGNKRTGLATAFIDGFKEARGKYICCMDSDLQHPPEIVPKLLQRTIADDADLTVASRYIKGGSAEGLGSLKTFYGIYRRLVSIGLKYFIQILFIPIRKTTDPGTGFFLFKKDLLSDKKLDPKGFKILIEIIMRTTPQKVSEVPFKFLSRKNDNSKASIGQGVEFLKHILYIFRTIPEAGRFLKFCIVGSSGVVINLGILVLLVEFFSIIEKPAYIIAVAVSIMTNYFFNSLLTYGDKKSSSRKENMRRMLYYYTISVTVMFFNFAIFSFGLSFGLHYILAAIIGIATATTLNFVLATKLVWKLSAKV